MLFFFTFVQNNKKMANKISLYGLISFNGTYATASTANDANPTLIDLDANKVAYVSMVKALKQNGETVDAFEIVCSNLKGFEKDVYLLGTNNDLTDIADFATALSGSDTTFVKYEDLLAINGSSVAKKDVLVNDLYLKSRRYVPSQGTFVFVDIHNAYQAQSFLFDGNQTIAGNYTYLND